MLKKTLIVSVLFLLIVSFSSTARATSVIGPNGYYQIVAGKLSATVNFPNYFKITLSLPKLDNIEDFLGGYFRFWYWEYWYGIDYTSGPFAVFVPLDLSSLSLPLINQPSISQTQALQLEEPTIVGEWSMTTPAKFVIVPADDTGQTIDLEQSINDLLATQEFPLNMITADVTKYSLTGSVNSNGTLKVTLSLGISIDAFITTGTISLTGTFNTAGPTYELPEPPVILSNTLSGPKGSTKGSSKELANWVVKILKTLPLRNVVPGQ